MILKIISFFLPWPLRRRALNRWFGFQIHPSAKIGFAWIFPAKLVMAEGAHIDHFSVAIHLDCIEMEAKSKIGRNNWITGFSTQSKSLHFKHQAGRQAKLFLGESAAVTKNHHLDCTNLIEIKRFSTVAGYGSQLLTHSINLFENRQDSHPISIGEYTFVGTNVVILGGAILPARSVLGAKSLLNKGFIDEWNIYAGVPAKPVGTLPKEAKYFSRESGFVI